MYNVVQYIYQSGHNVIIYIEQYLFKEICCLNHHNAYHIQIKCDDKNIYLLSLIVSS